MPDVGWVLVALVVVAMLFVVGLWRIRRAEAKAPRFSERGLPVTLDAPQAAAQDDITRLRSAIAALGDDVADHPFNEQLQQAYQQALDEYDTARSQVSSATRASMVAAATSAASRAQASLAEVRALLAGTDLPARRPPCFFDPSHGPSVTSVAWSGDQQIRHLPACSDCAGRVLTGQEPRVRMATSGNQRLPYWRSSSLAPWASGYFDAWLSDPLLGEAVALLVGPSVDADVEAP